MAAERQDDDGLPRYGHYIGGRDVAPASGAFLATEDPFTGRAWARIARGNGDDADAAVAAAVRKLSALLDDEVRIAAVAVDAIESVAGKARLVISEVQA
jgi:acyl-CoA reductase-like NAD-dependent aldehyde dehydrogenase